MKRSILLTLISHPQTLINLKIPRRKSKSKIVQVDQALFNTGQEHGHWPGPYLENGTNNVTKVLIKKNPKILRFFALLPNQEQAYILMYFLHLPPAYMWPCTTDADRAANLLY